MWAHNLNCSDSFAKVVGRRNNASGKPRRLGDCKCSLNFHQLQKPSILIISGISSCSNALQRNSNIPTSFSRHMMSVSVISASIHVHDSQHQLWSTSDLQNYIRQYNETTKSFLNIMSGNLRISKVVFSGKTRAESSLRSTLNMGSISFVKDAIGNSYSQHT